MSEEPPVFDQSDQNTEPDFTLRPGEYGYVQDPNKAEAMAYVEKPFQDDALVLGELKKHAIKVLGDMSKESSENAGKRSFEEQAKDHIAQQDQREHIVRLEQSQSHLLKLAKRTADKAKENYDVSQKYGTVKTFKGPDEAMAAINAGDAESVAYGLKHYKGLTREVALALIDAGQGGAVSWYPNKFEDLDHDEAILRLLAHKDDELYEEDDRTHIYRTKRLYDLPGAPSLINYRGIMQNLHKFDLKPETLDELEKRGFKKTVESYRAGKKPAKGLTRQQRIGRTLANQDLFD